MTDQRLQLERVPVMETGMLIRKPVEEVFRAFADPAVTTRFWYTKSTGPVEPGAELEWTWEMYDVSSPVKVKEFELNRRAVVEWGPPPATTTFEISFEPRADGNTMVTISETGYSGETGDAIVGWAMGSMGGFTQMLAAMKAYLEHGIVLSLVKDRYPDGKPE